MIGQTLDHYRIESKLGEGGMGVVYKARDVHLNRTVAVKVLPPDKLADPTRKQRFVQEARAASALNHPNIVTIHDIRSLDSTDFIVMEYVEGKTLAEVIPPKGMPQKQVLSYAVQIADALAKAHSAGILHRDVKPQNIMVTAEGRIKILDFGLAKLLEPAEAASESPTLAMSELTEEGAVVGTAAYMSPEQAEGRKLDGRSDIFSFGAVLYRMVTGQKPFGGDSRMALLNQIVNSDPLPPSQIVPAAPEVEKLILRCLRKDAARRYQTMADLKVALEDLQTETTAPQSQQVSVTAPQPAPSGRKPAIRRIAMFAAATLAALTAAVILWRVFPPAPAPLRTVKFTFTPKNLRRGADFNVDEEVSISPDGKHITYVEADGGQLWVRDIDQEQAHIVPGATHVYQVFWSPDSQVVGYAVGRDLMRIPLQGGTPVLITKLPGNLFRRASWSSDGETIVYCDTTGMYTVPAKGGPSTRIVEHNHIEHPSFLDLPGGRRAFLYQAVNDPPKHGIYVQVAGEKQGHLLTFSSSSNPYPAYSSGHVVYVDGRGESVGIWALPFSLATLKATGKAFPVAQHGSSPQVSRTGTLVYSDVPSDRTQLIWCDRSGKKLSAIGEIQAQDAPAVSPDGRRLAVVILEPDADIWIYDLERGVKSRFTFDGTGKIDPAWTPSGNEIVYASRGPAGSGIYAKLAGGSGEPRLLVNSPDDRTPDWSPDQRFLLYEGFSPKTKHDILSVERHGDGSLGYPVVFLQTPFDEAAPKFSPDGHFVAYTSNETGAYEVYVRDFPKGATKWQISANGGTAPRWSRHGKEIFYIAKGKLMAAPLTMHPTFSPGTPTVLFEQRSLASLYPEYDVSADGKRFVVRERPENEPPLAVHVVHNWFEEFRGRDTGGPPR
jgi:serine/threonine protein kinase/Tol biopolymer transport system component